MQKQIILTEDGSHTIYIPEMDEHYHSIHGAIQESQHIYVDDGLNYIDKKDLSILEIGFGTGLNAYLTYCHSFKKRKIKYTSIEKYPLKEIEYQKLNYPKIIFPEFAAIFKDLHQAKWNTWTELNSKFSLLKLDADLLNFQFEESPTFDLVYYDAFAPSKQPEMWTESVINKVSSSIKKGGILVTYCAKGTVRRAFRDAGFQMERISGPVGKKEILRGKKTI